MANKKLEISSGVETGAVSLDADTGNIATSGNISITGNGAIVSSAINSPVVKGERTVVANLGTLNTGTSTIDLTTAQIFAATIAASATVTFAFTNALQTSQSQVVMLRLTNAGAGTLNWPANTKYPGGAITGLTANGVDLLAVYYDPVFAAYVVMILGTDIK